MQQIKFFKGVETDIPQLERQVNDWIKAHHATVVNVFGNMSPQTMRPEGVAGARQYPPSDVFIAVVYEAA